MPLIIDTSVPTYYGIIVWVARTPSLSTNKPLTKGNTESGIGAVKCLTKLGHLTT